MLVLGLTSLSQFTVTLGRTELTSLYLSFLIFTGDSLFYWLANSAPSRDTRCLPCSVDIRWTGWCNKNVCLICLQWLWSNQRKMHIISFIEVLMHSGSAQFLYTKFSHSLWDLLLHLSFKQFPKASFIFSSMVEQTWLHVILIDCYLFFTWKCKIMIMMQSQSCGDWGCVF